MYRYSNPDPIAYTYDADVHCPACTEERFGRGPDGFIAEDPTDSEGNTVGAVFGWDRKPATADEPEFPGYCSDCGGEL